MIGATSGGLGDIIYAIPTMHKLNINTLYVKESYYYEPYGNLYKAIKRLLAINGIMALPTSGNYKPHFYDPDIKFDYDLDFARLQPNRKTNHIMISYLNSWRLNIYEWNKPWLEVSGEHDLKPHYNLVHVTDRWRKGSHVKWRDIIKNIYNPVFVGFLDEYYQFIEKTKINIPYYPTDDILDLACVIKDCDALYCNQSVSLTIAQGLGKTYYLDKNPRSDNAIMKTPNEHIL